MIEKAILLIDDGRDHLKVLDNIKSILKKESISLTTKYINPNDFDYLDVNKDPDIDKLIEGVKTKLNSIRPNLIVVDQFYSGNLKYKGINVIEKLRNISKYKRCSIFLISGKRDKIVRDIFLEEDSKVAEKVNRLAKLIGLKIEQFLDKDFKDEAIQLLKLCNTDEILPTKLRNFESEDFVINKFTPKYKTLTFSELADKIDSSDPESSEVLDEMFDLTLSHYSRINDAL